MKLKILLAFIAGKLILSASRLLKTGGGSAAPGLYALKIETRFIEYFTQNIPLSVVITGTNGKTTTAKIISHLFSRQGNQVLRNSTGSNMERGIASAIIQSFTLIDLLTGNFKQKYDTAVWETDEAVLPHIISKLNPKAVLFLNIFRDQLDRYGEIDTIVKKWFKATEGLKKDCLVMINGDDHNLHQLKAHFRGQIFTFGLEGMKIKGESSHLSQEKLDFQATNLKLNSLEGSSFTFTAGKKNLDVHITVPGLYHVYDFLAALAVAANLGLDLKKSVACLENFSPAFGRVEKFSLRTNGATKDNEGYIFLIKNPTGATEVFKTLQNEITSKDRLLIALNDKIADGTDVSWIWDADFEIIRNSSEVKMRDCQIICSGIRADDLAIRLKYAGFNPKRIQIVDDLSNAFLTAQEEIKGKLFILPTYTAMLELQKILTSAGIKKHYWEESD